MIFCVCTRKKDIMVFRFGGSSNAHAQTPLLATDSPGPYYMSANSKGSGETALMRRLAWVCAGRLCDQYHFLMCWLIFDWINQKKLLIKGSFDVSSDYDDGSHVWLNFSLQCFIKLIVFHTWWPEKLRIRKIKIKFSFVRSLARSFVRSFFRSFLPSFISSVHSFVHYSTFLPCCKTSIYSNTDIQSNLVVSNSLISNYRLSQSENLVPVLIWNYDNR